MNDTLHGSSGHGSSGHGSSGMARIVRWIARIGSLFSIGLLLTFLIGEGGNPAAITWSEWAMLFFFPFGVIVGLALGWWKEGVGGLIAVGSLAAFYLLETLFSGDPPGGPYFTIFASPGAFFLISWWLDMKSEE